MGPVDHVTNTRISKSTSCVWVWLTCRVREDDGRKLDHQTLETLRFRAVAAVQAGRHPEEVAVTLGLHRKTVYGWLAQLRDGGADALRARPVPGRPSVLTGEQMRRLYELVAGNDPRQLSFGSALWTRDMIGALIHREFDVTVSVSTVGRVLHRLGLSPQRPLWRAYQQNPAAVEAWKTETFPAIRKQAKKDNAVIYFCDEAGLRSDYHAGTTWAPVGHTPLVSTTGARHSLNMISAITATGTLRFTTFTGSCTAARFIDFCKRLLQDTNRPVYLIVDGHIVHRAKATTTFVDRTHGRLRLFFLPGYSPQLNPDEWVWKNVKHDRVGRAGVHSADDLRTKATRALRALQRCPRLIQSFFADPDLRYITA